MQQAVNLSHVGSNPTLRANFGGNNERNDFCADNVAR